MKLSLVLVLLLSGCAIWAWDVVEEKKPLYIGEPVETVIMKFGAPSATGKVKGKDFFTWTNSSTHISSTPQYNTSFSSGTFSTGYGGDTGTFSGSTGYTSYTTRSTQLNCTFTVIAKNGLITDMDVNGNNGACKAYSNRL